MRIGIIGAGNLGGTLAQHFTAAGHDVIIANSRRPNTLSELVAKLGDRVQAGEAKDVPRLSDMVVVAVPFGRHEELATEGLEGKTVIDASNYDPERDGHYPDLDQDRTTSSELVQTHVGDARVVKAFNAMRWDHLRDYGRGDSAMNIYGVPVSGDDDQSKSTVLGLVKQIGFDPVDAGDLAHGGRKHQPGTSLFNADLVGRALRVRLGAPASL